jgi:hypothetical protein
VFRTSQTHWTVEPGSGERAGEAGSAEDQLAALAEIDPFA